MSLTADSPFKSPPALPEPPVTDYASPGGTVDRGTDARPDVLLPGVADESPGTLWWGRVMGLLVVAFVGFVVFRFFAGGDMGVDQNAYLVGGRLLADHFSMKYVLPNPYAYTGGMMIRMENGTYYPKYPIGLPLLFAMFFWVFRAVHFLGGRFHLPAVRYLPMTIAVAVTVVAGAGTYALTRKVAGAVYAALIAVGSLVAFHLIQNAGPNQAAYWAFMVSPLATVLGVAGTFLLARRVAGSFAAAMAALLLGSSQLMLMLADNPNSHAACMCAVVWGFYGLVRAMQTPGKVVDLRVDSSPVLYVRAILTDSATWWGIFGGLMLGYAGTIRYSEQLMVLPVVVAVIGRMPLNRVKTWRSLACAFSLMAAVYLVILQYDAHKAFKAGTAVEWSLGAKILNIAGIILLLAAAGTALLFSILRNRIEDWFLYARAIAPGLAWAVPVGLMRLLNTIYLGSPTGYDSTHESEFGAAFKWSYLHSNWEKVVRVLYDLGLFFVLPFAVAGLVMAFRKSWRLGLMLVLGIVPGTMLYMAYYWSPDRADAYARFFVSYLPLICVAAAICFHDGLLAGGKSIGSTPTRAVTATTGVVVALAAGVLFYATYGWTFGHPHPWSTPAVLWVPAGLIAVAALFHDGLVNPGSARSRWQRVPLTLAVGMVVAVASGISVYRTVNGMRDGSKEAAKIPLDDFRERLTLAETGQVLLENVPAKSVLFAENTGGIQTPCNYIQFLNDWELYAADTFSYQAARRGFGGGGNRNRPNNNNGRGGRGGPGGMGGGPGGPGMGGPPGGGNNNNNGGNNNQDANADPTATPIQREQQEYHASLYKDTSASKLYGMEAEVIQKAFKESRRVFLLVGQDTEESANMEAMNRRGGGGFNFGGAGSTADALKTFKDNLNTTGRYDYKIVSAWQDVALPAEKDEDKEKESDNGWGGNNMGNRMMNRMFMAANRVMNWKLIEIKPGTAAVAKPATPKVDPARVNRRRP